MHPNVGYGCAGFKKKSFYLQINYSDSVKYIYKITYSK